MLIQTLITDTNIQVDFKKDNKLWGISFIKKEDNSEYLAQIPVIEDPV